VALGQVFSEYFGFPWQYSFHQLLHNHPHLSSAAGTIGQKWPQYKGLSPTPLAIKEKCQAPWGAQDHIFVIVRQFLFCRYEEPLLNKRTGLLFTSVNIRNGCYVYLQCYMSPFYIVTCQESGSLWIHPIYSFTRNSIVYVCTIYRVIHKSVKHFENLQ
jgi:hypothetical protein